VDERANFAFLLSQTGWFAFLSSRTARGRALSDEALSLAGPGSTPEHLWYMNSQRGYIELVTGNLAEARRFSQQGLKHAGELTNSWYLGFPLAQLGMIALDGHLKPETILAEAAQNWKSPARPNPPNLNCTYRTEIGQGPRQSLILGAISKTKKPKDGV
jgi:hypothetical protein